MARTIRTVISVGFVGACLWVAFAVPMGDKTLAEHIDAIGDTPEASELLDGARGTINPALDEVKDRILGEHVTAPTHLPAEPDPPDLTAGLGSGSPSAPSKPETEPESRAVGGDDEPAGIYASDANAPRLPGGGPSTGDRVRLPGSR